MVDQMHHFVQICFSRSTVASNLSLFYHCQAATVETTRHFFENCFFTTNDRLKWLTKRNILAKFVSLDQPLPQTCLFSTTFQAATVETTRHFFENCFFTTNVRLKWLTKCNILAKFVSLDQPLPQTCLFSTTVRVQRLRQRYTFFKIVSSLPPLG